MRKRKVALKSIGECLLTLREAAEVLRLNPRTLREYISRGELEGRIIGGRWRFRRVDLDAFFENAPREWGFAGKRSHRGLDGEQASLPAKSVRRALLRAQSELRTGSATARVDRCLGVG